MYHTSIKWELSHDHAGTFKFDLRLLLFELRRFKQVSLISWQSLLELRGGKIVFVADASILCITLQQLQVSEDV